MLISMLMSYKSCECIFHSWGAHFLTRGDVTSFSRLMPHGISEIFWKKVNSNWKNLCSIFYQPTLGLILFTSKCVILWGFWRTCVQTTVIRHWWLKFFFQASCSRYHRSSSYSDTFFHISAGIFILKVACFLWCVIPVQSNSLGCFLFLNGVK